jgi:putative tryptophan/tyrosine transport system substrate-binding protein
MSEKCLITRHAARFGQPINTDEVFGTQPSAVKAAGCQGPAMSNGGTFAPPAIRGFDGSLRDPQPRRRQMIRRDFLTLIGATAVWPHAGHAQQSKMHRIGALLLGNADAESFRMELREGLKKTGYIEGQNLLFDFRSAEGKLDLLPTLAAELVALKVDVIVALYTPCALAAQQATRQIPIVVVSGDPLATGLVASLARPGGNITGISLMAAELHGKCVELFRDILPSVRRVAILLNAEDSFWKQIREQVQLAGRASGIEIAPSLMVREPNEIEVAFATMKKEGAGAVVVHGSLSTKNVAELALKHGLPAATQTRSFAEVGGLMSYGADGPDLFRQSALFVTKVLQGGNPTNMPVEQPTKFELAINLRTAKALGITVPESFLLRADQVIE